MQVLLGLMISIAMFALIDRLYVAYWRWRSRRRNRLGNCAYCGKPLAGQDLWAFEERTLCAPCARLLRRRALVVAICFSVVMVPLAALFVTQIVVGEELTPGLVRGLVAVVGACTVLPLLILYERSKYRPVRRTALRTYEGE